MKAELICKNSSKCQIPSQIRVKRNITCNEAHSEFYLVLFMLVNLNTKKFREDGGGGPVKTRAA